MDHKQNETPKSPPPEGVPRIEPKKFSRLLEKESDRGVILILSAYLEEILGSVVRAACTSDELGKDLLEFRQPGGDFSSKTSLCLAFGLISPDEAKALNALRKIRNAAAHFDQKGRGFDVLFDSTQTIDQVEGFMAHLNLGRLDSKKPKYIRWILISGGRLLACKLLMRAVMTPRPLIAKSIKEIANEYRATIKNTEKGRIMAEAEKEALAGKPEKSDALMQQAFERLKDAAARGKADKSKPRTTKPM